MEDSTQDECLELALQGEALCRAGDFVNGVEVFLRALAADTDDVAVLSAIYIQLGNAYFYLESYDKALEYHSKDIRIARNIGDENGEAKASGNIAMTLKCLGQYEESIACGQRQLDIYRKLNDDKVAISRALYNIGNIYLAKAKSGIAAAADGELPEQAKEDLIYGLEYYRENLSMVKSFGDLAAQGRVCGNLGSCQYMLGNFPQAVMYHQERLLLARECKDIPAERRAYTNLGNCHVFLGQYPVAEQYYLKALALVDPQSDSALEAQACYSLGNTYSLMGDHGRAVEYYSRHLVIAKELQDAVGQGRACWSLGAAHAALGDTGEAIRYAEEHLRISQDLGDAHQCSYAEANLQEYAFRSDGTPASAEDITARIKRISMEQMDLLKLTPDVRGKYSAKRDVDMRNPSPAEASTSSAQPTILPTPPQPPRPTEEDMFDLISRCQSQRLDDQRCTFVANNKENNNHSSNNHHQHYGNGSSKTGTAHANARTFEDLMDMIAGVQCKRLDEQRADLPSPPVIPERSSFSAAGRKSDSGEGDSLTEDFFDMLVKVQGSRMGDQRATLTTVGSNVNKAATVPDEDFANLIQSRRRVSSKGPLDKLYAILLMDSIAGSTAISTISNATGPEVKLSISQSSLRIPLINLSQSPTRGMTSGDNSKGKTCIFGCSGLFFDLERHIGESHPDPDAAVRASSPASDAANVSRLSTWTTATDDYEDSDDISIDPSPKRPAPAKISAPECDAIGVVDSKSSSSSAVAGKNLHSTKEDHDRRPPKRLCISLPMMSFADKIRDVLKQNGGGAKSDPHDRLRAIAAVISQRTKSIAYDFSEDDGKSYLESFLTRLQTLIGDNAAGNVLLAEVEKLLRIMVDSKREYQKSGSDLLQLIVDAANNGKQVPLMRLCTKAGFYGRDLGDAGWGCGYRNAQMLIAALLEWTATKDYLKKEMGMDCVPNIPTIQAMIQMAWKKGFSAHAAAELGGAVQGTSKWIGTTEIQVLFSSLKLECYIKDFSHSSSKSTQPIPSQLAAKMTRSACVTLQRQMWQFVYDYFSQHATSADGFIPPMYIQYEGHSRTIIGVDYTGLTPPTDDPKLMEKVGLLIFDPAQSQRDIELTGNPTRKWYKEKVFCAMSSFKEPMYQILYFTGNILNEAGYQGMKQAGAAHQNSDDAFQGQQQQQPEFEDHSHLLYEC